MIIMNKSACSAVICQPSGCEQNHDSYIIMDKAIG